MGQVTGSGRRRHLASLSPADVRDPALKAVMKRAEAHRSPPVSWYLTMGHNPEVASAYAAYWDLLHRGGSVPHRIKEVCRIAIAQMIGCDFCAQQSSPFAAISPEEADSCALPDWEHPDAPTRAALHYARTLTLDDGRDSEVYDELTEFYSPAEIIELSAFFCLTAGGNRMAKSWGIEADEDNLSIPAGAMSIHRDSDDATTTSQHPR
jgi:alkylhydroperoxidase family enzyme